MNLLHRREKYRRGIYKATPHKDCAEDVQSIFSSDCTKATQEYCRISRSFCVIWRKKRKQIRYKAVRRSLCGVAIRERPLLQGVPSFKTVHWTVLKFTLCGAPEGCIDLRSIWGAAPNPAKGTSSLWNPDIGRNALKNTGSSRKNCLCLFILQ